MQQIALRSNDSDLALCHLDALSERTQMVAAVAAPVDPNPLTSSRGELPHHGRRDGLVAGPFKGGGHSLGLSLRLVADRIEAGDAVLECRVVQIGHAAFDRVVKPLEPQIGFRGPLVQFGDMLAAALSSLLPTIEHGCQHFLKPLGLKQSVFDMAGNEIVELLHRDRAALAPGLALARFNRARVVAIPPRS